MKDNPGTPGSAAAALFKWHPRERVYPEFAEWEADAPIMNPMACFIAHSQSQNPTLLSGSREPEGENKAAKILLWLSG